MIVFDNIFGLKGFFIVGIFLDYMKKDGLFFNKFYEVIFVFGDNWVIE